MRKMIVPVLIAAVAFFSAACGGGNDELAESAPTPITAPASPSAAPTATFPPLSDEEFTRIGYKPVDGEEGAWESDSSQTPVLYTDGYNVTSFKLRGIICEVTTEPGVQATPAFVLIMAIAIDRDGGVRRGASDPYNQGGWYSCK